MAPFPAPTKTWHTDTYAAIDPFRPGLSLAGKSVVITGGGSGIGGAIAQSCAKAGAATIVLIGRREHILQDNKAKIASISSKTNVLVLTADIGNEGQVNEAFKSIKAALGPVDVFVNNAAYFSGAGSLIDDSIDEWFAAFETNVKGSVLAIRGFLTVAKPDATVVNISTAIAHMKADFFPGFSAYAASKVASTRAFDYLQSERPDLHVVSVHPGQVVTDMAAKVGMTTTIDTGQLTNSFDIKCL